MRRSRREFLSLLMSGAASSVALATGGCLPRQRPRTDSGASSDAAVARPGQLVLYSPEEREYLHLLTASFTSATGFEVVFPPLGSAGAVFDILRADRRQHVTLADVLYGGGPFLFPLLEHHGFIGPAEPGAMPPHWREVDLTAFLFAGRGPEPSGLGSLWRLPSRDFRLILPDAGQWAFGTMLAVAVLYRFQSQLGDFERGWDFWSDVFKGPVELVPNLAGLMDGIQQAQQTVALVPHHLAVSLASGIPGVWLRWPEEVPVFPNFAAEARGAPRTQIASRFLDWLRTEAAHQAMAAAGRLPGDCSHTLPACQMARSVKANALPLDVEWGFGKYNEVRREWQRRYWKR